MNDMYAMLALMQYENSNNITRNSSSINDYGDDNWATPDDKKNDEEHLKNIRSEEVTYIDTRVNINNELDVHGCSHEEVAHEIENLLIMQYNTGNWPLTVVTGNSQKMKSLVIKHASRRGFNTKLPVNNNPGSIVVF